MTGQLLDFDQWSEDVDTALYFILGLTSWHISRDQYLAWYADGRRPEDVVALVRAELSAP